MINNIIYLLATISLLIGSILSFNNNYGDYFYLIGTILFVINSLFRFLENMEKNKNINNSLLYDYEYTERYI